MTNVMKWAAAFAAVAGMAFGLIGGDGGTSAFASPPNDDHGDDHGGLLWEPGDSNVYIAESPEVQAILDGTAIRPQAAVNITVNYIGSWTSDQQTALERAVTIWESIIEGTGPIVIDASLDSGLTGLGQGGPNLSTFSGQPKPNTWYPLALINQIRGLDHDTGRPEINLKMKPTHPFPGTTARGMRQLAPSTSRRSPCTKSDTASASRIHSPVPPPSHSDSQEIRSCTTHSQCRTTAPP